MNLLKTLKHLPRKAYHSETLDYRARLLAAGGTISETSLDYAEKFVQDCCNANLWPKLHEIGLFLGDQLAGALVKLKYSAASSLVNHNFTSGNYAERGANGGLLGDGLTKYLDTGCDAQSLPLNCHLSFYLREDVGAIGNRGLIGAFSATQHVFLGSLTPATDVTCRLGDVVDALVSHPFTRGFYVGNRTASNNLELHQNGAIVAQSASPVAGPFPSVPLSLWAWSRALEGDVQAYLPARGSFYSIGDGLTVDESAALFAAVQTLQRNLNREFQP